MYKSDNKLQSSFLDFNQPMGLHMNPENPYLQYFIGLPGYQETPPFDASTLVLFRKRINARMLMEANEYLLEENKPDKKEDDNDDQTPPSDNGTGDSDQSCGEK